MMDRAQFEGVADSLKIDQAVRFDRHQMAEAYPPIGMDMFKALALARGGNRPEPVMNTIDQVRQFCARHGLEPSFSPMDGSVTIRPKAKDCGTCHGRKKVQQYERVNPRLPMTRSTRMVKFELVDCPTCAGVGWSRAPGDPDARFGNHSASDAWIAARRHEREAQS